VDNTELRAEPLDIITDVGLQRLEIHAILVQYMQYLFLERESRRLGIEPGLLMVCLEALTHACHEFRRNIRHCLQSRGLEVFKAGMVEDLANRSLKGSSVDPRSHQRTIFRDDHVGHILLNEWRQFVLRELILVCLLSCQSL
jgi:hypothetical protein